MRQFIKTFSERGPNRLVSPFWLLAGAASMSYAWLLPNYHLPWSSFHRDAWLAMNLMLAAFVVMFSVRDGTPWHPITILIAVLVPVPLLQWAGGVILLAGTAWTNTAYLLGLLLAMLTGAAWARRNPTELIDGLFVAIAIAATLSVALVLIQWLDMSDYGVGIWILTGSQDRRAQANLGQPNQLATFLIWGMVAVSWLCMRGFLRGRIALPWIMYLLVGVAMAQSRTSWLTLMVLGGFAIYWRRLFGVRHLPWVLAFLAIYFILLNQVMDPLAHAWYLGESIDMAEKFGHESRPAIWNMLLDATLQRPWFGYGWGQVLVAQLTVAQTHPETIGRSLSHAHNIFLDFFLYMGWPAGIFLTACVLWWLGNQIRRVATPLDALLVLFVLAIGIHAQLELPMHYGYMLLPLGIVVGTLNTRNSGQQPRMTRPWLFASLCIAGTLLLGAVIRDYLMVESNYMALRFEKARIGNLPPEPTPDLWLLTQHKEILRMGRTTIQRGMSEEELDAMRKVVYTYPSGLNIHLFSEALGINGHPQEAQQWLAMVCFLLTDESCEITKYLWGESQKNYPELASIKVGM